MPGRQRRLDFSFDPDDLVVRPVPVLGGRPSVSFRVQRPRDLLDLWVTGYDLELQQGGDGPPALMPNGQKALLVVRFAFQHLGEQAFYEDGAPPPPPPAPAVEPPDDPPVRALAAHGSRLVLAVAEGESVEYSIDGVLAALTRLPLVVVPLATPRQVPPWRRVQVTDGLLLAGGLRLLRAGGQVAVVPDPTGAQPPTRTATDLLRVGRDLRTARALVGTGSPRHAPGARLRPDDLVREQPVFRPRRSAPRAPRQDETALEAPFRLVLSPSSAGGFTHSLVPASAPDDPSRVELWHTRLGTRRTRDGVVEVDERPGPQKAVRAVWARDLEGTPPPGHDLLPFRMSLDGLDRVILVRQSSDPTIAPPEPVTADRLHLSALGAWLDLHGGWETKPYTSAPHHKESIDTWDHRAPMGRDSYVKVTYPGYLFPFGHRASLVKVTERRILDRGAGPQAWLFQHKFVVVREPERTYADRGLPFTRVRLSPTVTPWLADPLLPGALFAPQKDKLFWPVVGTAKLPFVLDCLDADGRDVRLTMPLLFVAAQLPDGNPGTNAAALVTEWLKDPTADGAGQAVAFAPSTVPGDTSSEVRSLSFTGVPGAAGSQRSEPSLTGAQVVLPAMRHLGPSAPPAQVAYSPEYLDHGFGAGNVGEMLLTLVGEVPLSFGAPGAGTDRAGGLVAPNLPVRGVSRLKGAVGDPAGVAAGTFNPATYFAGLLPRLFGLFSLTDLLGAVGLDEAPDVISEALDSVAALLSDLEQLEVAVADGLKRLAAEATRPTSTGPQQAAAQAAADALLAAAGDLSSAVAALNAEIGRLFAGEAPDPTVLTDLFDALRAIVDATRAAVDASMLPASVTAMLDRPLRALQPMLDPSGVVATIEAVLRFVAGIDPAGMSVRARLEWAAPLKNYSFTDPTPADDDAVFVSREGKGLLRLSVEARVSGSGGAGVDALAEITDFALNLLPGAPLMRLSFDRLAFRASTGRKADVDLVFGGIEFLGVLGFVNTLKELIPGDGFSDPPFLDLSADGVTAGFDLALPSIAVGVFALENISLHADARVPFLGEAVTVGFAFCSREKPFSLTVSCIGGGGFVGFRASPKGLVLLEMSLEAGARLSVDLGVASGSVSVAVGMYLRLEGDTGSLTGYFRIRGEVDVLGLISASITLELSLTYEFDSGKMVGRASIDIEVEVFLLSFSVSVSAERRLAGSNGDPTFAELLGVADDGASPAWDAYCSAFTAESRS